MFRILQINFNKNFKCVISLWCKKQAIFYYSASASHKRTRRVKKEIINQRPVFLRKKCLNVIRVRVWPKNDETDAADRSNQARREKETRTKAEEEDREREA